MKPHQQTPSDPIKNTVYHWKTQRVNSACEMNKSETVKDNERPMLAYMIKLIKNTD